MPRTRTPLSRDRVVAAAMAFADSHGIEALSMRRLGEQLGVEAMSLYAYIANKDDLLDAILDRVVSEMDVPTADLGWRDGLRRRAVSARAVLLKHRWAPTLIESRLSPGPARLRLNEAVLRVLREAGFSIELAYSAFLTLDSYIYGFTLQEVVWPFEPEQRAEVVLAMRPAIDPKAFPHLDGVMGFLLGRGAGQRGSSSAAGYDADFEFGLDVILEGFERRRG